jgi:uncharacterized protein
MTTGALNLAFHDGSGRADPPAAGREIEVALPFQATAWRLAAGHRIGLLLSADGWPTLWPGRAGATLSVQGLELSLPLAAGDAPAVAAFAPAVTAPASAVGPAKWLDPARETLLPTGLSDAAAQTPPAFAYHLAATGTDYRLASRFELALADGGRQAAAAKVYRAAFERPDWSIRVATRLVVRSAPAAFAIDWTVQAWDGGQAVFDRSDRASVPRSVV